MTNVYIEFDGGKSPEKPAYGSYRIRFDDGAVFENLRFDIFDANTSNEAEYLSLTRGLKRLLFVLSQSDTKPSSIALHIAGDSLLVANQITGKYRCKNDRMHTLCKQACSLINQFNAQSTVKWCAREHSLKAFGH